jgi:hypothetical protein
MRGQEGNVFAMGRQVRELQGHDFEAIVEILAEIALLHFGFETAMSR